MWRHIAYLLRVKHKVGNIKQECVFMFALIAQHANSVRVVPQCIQTAKCISCTYLANYEIL
jgi:hypothetical protein